MSFSLEKRMTNRAQSAFAPVRMGREYGTGDDLMSTNNHFLSLQLDGSASYFSCAHPVINTQGAAEAGPLFYLSSFGIRPWQRLGFAAINPSWVIRSVPAQAYWRHETWIAGQRSAARIGSRTGGVG
jgi:hypothetical protein